ncbi:uncharacterized protein KGF55_003160 [Candida pseudojiufengensis]|uniref:uncharacterized protein n=1 Tax=Candida pseudojiufengensis TaxID=497109 RepID=UPI00222574B2|nr:uncharacterized protein KGF55_003160 [Candida pseudojiufengensis]KAI5962085.1 hypothetical protein KGF55_003160 [Candida pseudojiufengensis]
MTLLDEQLKRIEDGTKLLNSYYFQDQGMFTNSIINETPTSFLQDSTPDERQLYRVVHKNFHINQNKNLGKFYDTNTIGEDPIIERIDGKSIYKEILPGDEILDINDDYENEYDKPMVRVPELYTNDLHEQNKGSTFFTINFGSETLENQINELIQTINEYPDLILNYQSIKDKCEILKENYLNSVNEIEEIEDEIAIIQDAMNDSRSDSLIDLQELINAEEEEIHRLENVLEKRQETS